MHAAPRGPPDHWLCSELIVVGPEDPHEDAVDATGDASELIVGMEASQNDRDRFRRRTRFGRLGVVTAARVPPGWNWVPPGGTQPRPDLVARWLRVLYRMPIIDRYSHELMWRHGGFLVLPPGHRLA